MTKQPEALLEHNLIQQLGDLGYIYVKVQDGDALLSN
jgi:type I restriction enzyme R subunit